jgi:hypothetical protein
MKETLDMANNLIHELAKSWAFNEKELKVYPEVVRETYKTTNSKGKKVTMNKVKLIVQIGNSRHVGTQLYKQGLEMANKANEIYIHYYNQRSQ